MRFQRTIPPAVAPINFVKILSGISGITSRQKIFRRIEEEIRDYFRINHVFFLSSGKACLYLILKAFETLAPQRKKVIIPAYSCFSVPSAVVKKGLEVIPCEMKRSTLDFDYECLENLIDEDTLCVVPTHFMGIPSDLDRIKKLCGKKGVFVLEDAAQAMGGYYKGRLLGTIGDAGLFSLGRGKNITCVSGGILMTNSETIARAIEKEYKHIGFPSVFEDIKEVLKAAAVDIFIRPSLYWFPSGLPFLKLGKTVFHDDFPVKKLSGIQAGFLKNWRREMEESNSVRRENAKFFCEKLKLKTAGGDSIPYLRLPVILRNKEIRDNLYNLSFRKGLGLSRMYPAPINEIDEMKDRFNMKPLRSAKAISEQLITIPTHSLLNGRDKEKICKLFAQLPISTKP